MEPEAWKVKTEADGLKPKDLARASGEATAIGK